MNVLMPQLGETVTEGTVANWHKKVGDKVVADEIILDIETDKVSMEIPAPGNGFITQILVPAGTTVAVGTVLAVVESSMSAAAEAPAAKPARRAGTGRHRAAAPQPPSWYAAMPPDMNTAKEQYAPRAAASACAARGRRDRRSRRARRAINGCRRPCAASPPSTGSISKAVSGSGRNGRITRRNVLEFIQRQQTAPRSRSRRGSPLSRAARSARAARAAPRAPGARGAAAGRREDDAVHAHPQAHGRAHGALEGHEPARAASRRGRFLSRRPRAPDRARCVEGEARPLADVLAVHRATPCAARSRISRT